MVRRYQVSVRKTNGLEIWFVSPRDIYIKDRYGWQNFTRWDVRQQWFYSKNWRPFARALRDYRYLDMGIIRRLATLNDISIRSGSLPEWVDKNKVRIIPEKGRNRNREDSQPLYDFIIRNKINLNNFIVKRIELSLEWQEEARSFAIGLPFVLFENQAIGKYAVSYEYFKKLAEEVEPNPRSRGAESVMHSDGTPPFLEDEK